MEQYRQTDGNNYYLKHLTKEGEYKWIKITLESSTESTFELATNEIILNKPQHNYYFTQDNEVIEEPPMGIQWENLGHFE
tara:strand:+ start:370 stop:609 length:240 start_codon:yes stop_codon:yes gene_type:complete